MTILDEVRSIAEAMQTRSAASDSVSVC